MSREYLERLCEDRNRVMTRDDIEWYFSRSGSMELRTKPHVLTERMKADQRRFDEETRKAKHRAEFPIAGEAA